MGKRSALFSLNFILIQALFACGTSRALNPADPVIPLSTSASPLPEENLTMSPAPALSDITPASSTPSPAPAAGLPVVSFPVLQAIAPENAGQLELLRTLEIPGYTRGRISQCSVAFNPDGRLLVGACGVNRVPVWDVQSGQIRHLLYAAPQQIVACSFSPDGNTIACGGFDRVITLWNTQTGEKAREFGPLLSPVWDLAFSPDGQKLASCGLADQVELWEVSNGKQIWGYEGKKAYLSVSYDPAGKSVAFGGRWGDAGVLDAVTGNSLLELITLNNPVGDVTFSPSGRLLAAGTDDQVIYLWNTGNSQQITTFAGHRHYVNGVSFNPEETLLASGSHDKSIGLWDIGGRRSIKLLEGHQDAVLRVSFSPDGKLLASISWDGTVRLWGVVKK